MTMAGDNILENPQVTAYRVRPDHCEAATPTQILGASSHRLWRAGRAEWRVPVRAINVEIEPGRQNAAEPTAQVSAGRHSRMPFSRFACVMSRHNSAFGLICIDLR